ncbi:MAG: shikimate kinase [bacterium]|nr:shikimate kinase [bacterium]
MPALPGPKENVILIGMAYSGKSTVGPLLARRLLLQFLDTDLLIQAGERATLQALIESRGVEEFKRLEERYVTTLDCRGFVVATGGSVVYSRRSIDHLKRLGPLVHLDVPLQELESRLCGMGTRGLVMEGELTFAALFEARKALYTGCADLTVPCAAMAPEEIAGEIVRRLALRR